MRTATQNLEDDHVHILRLIDVMEHITRTEDTDKEKIEEILSIIRNFADGLHHAKEENIFFPYLGEKGFSSERGPVAVMLNEHELGRNFVKGIEDNLRLYKAGNMEALSEVYMNMNQYCSLLRNHISKENNILFKMADNALSESEHEILLKEFSESEKNFSHRTGSEGYINMIEELVNFYRISVD